MDLRRGRTRKEGCLKKKKPNAFRKRIPSEESSHYLESNANGVCPRSRKGGDKYPPEGTNPPWRRNTKGEEVPPVGDWEYQNNPKGNYRPSSHFNSRKAKRAGNLTCQKPIPCPPKGKTVAKRGGRWIKCHGGPRFLILRVEEIFVL